MDASIPTTIASLLSSPVGVVLMPDVLILESDATVDEATKRMEEKNSRSVLASRLREIMTSPVLAVGPSTTVKEALSIMDKHNVRQVMVHAYAAVIGMVTRDNIFQKMEMISTSSEDTMVQGTPVCLIDSKTIAYIKDDSKIKLKCPYCESPFDTKEGLSKHIDRLHGESGALEGDVRHLYE